MSADFAAIAFTPAVRALQSRMGSRSMYARLDPPAPVSASAQAPDAAEGARTATPRGVETAAAARGVEQAAAARGVEQAAAPRGFGAHEVDFIRSRDTFYQATVSETGWPYVQHKGGPAGFLKVLGPRTLAYADFRGNRQYVSDGNLAGNDRVSLLLMDFAERQRLKILGRARLVEVGEDRALAAALVEPGYRASIERAVVIDVQAWDWNCPQHITPRFTREEWEAREATAAED